MFKEHVAGHTITLGLFVECEQIFAGDVVAVHIGAFKVVEGECESKLNICKLNLCLIMKNTRTIIYRRCDLEICLPFLIKGTGCIPYPRA